MKSPSSSVPFDTGCGILAVIIWSASICLSRSLLEKLGTFTGAGTVFSLAGTLSVLLYFAAHRGDFRRLRMSPRYLAACGIPFILYIVCLYLALGLAKTRQEVVEVGLLNYLWPTLVLLLSVPILKNRARPWLAFGIVTAFAGILLATATMSESPFDLRAVGHRAADNATAYLLALAAAVLWGLYCNLARRFAAQASGLGVPVFMLASGLLLLGAGVFFPAPACWSGTALAELAAMVLLPCIAAYMLWERAMRRGDLVLVASFAYLAPVLSTVCTGWYLGVKLPFGIWGAAALIMAGAWIARKAITEHAGPAS